MFKKNIPSKITCSLIILTVLSILFQSFNLLIIGISLGLAYKIFSQLISKTIFDSKLFISILILFSCVILMQCTILISCILNRNFPLSYIPSLLLVILYLIHLYNKHYLHKKDHNLLPVKTKVRILNLQDIVSLLTAVAIIAVIVIPPLALKPEFARSTSIMSLITGNVDDTSHLSLLNDNLQFDRGVLSRSDAAGQTRKGGFYPSGWHAVSAVFIKMFNPTIQTGSASLLAYGIQKLFWFFILLYLLARVSFTVYRFLSGNKPKAPAYIWISTAAIFLGYTFLLPIFKEGFYSFLPQLIATLLAIPVIIQLTKEKDKKDFYRALPFLFIVGIGGCLSWFLPLPSFFLTVLFIVLEISINKNFKKTFNNILRILKENIIILAILASATLFQFYVMISIHDDSALTFLASILMGGGITTYDKIFYMFISVGFIASLLLAIHKAKKNIHLSLSLFAALILFCTYIFFVQIEHMGKNEYFYFKMLDILTLAAIPFCIAGFNLIFDKITIDRKAILISITLTIITIATLVQLIGLDSSTLSFARGYRAFSSPLDNSILNELDNHVSQTNYYNKNYSFYYVPDPNFYFQNEVAMLMAKSNAPDSNCFTIIRHSIWKTPPIEQLLDSVDKDCKGYNVDIITNKASFQAFKAAVDNAGLDNSVRIKSY